MRKKADGCSSKYLGVCYDKQFKNWRARIRVDGITRNVGSYKTEIEARDAFFKAAVYYNVKKYYPEEQSNAFVV